jgi:elongation factor P
MYSTTDFRKGLKIDVDGMPFEIVDFQHFKPGKGGAMIRTKLRNILNGLTREITFRSGDKVEQADLETREMQLLYKDGDELIFMDQSSYEQLHIQADRLDGKHPYLKDGQMVEALFYKGELQDIDLPVSLVFEVVTTEPGVKGDTVSNVLKPAVTETGLSVQVPIFVNIGDKIKVDTRTGEYISRVS